MTYTSGWRRSSRSFTGDCVEVRKSGQHVHIRDSKNPGQKLDIPSTRWFEFIGFAKPEDVDNVVAPTAL
jgi:hypothetical protein